MVSNSLEKLERTVCLFGFPNSLEYFLFWSILSIAQLLDPLVEFVLTDLKAGLANFSKLLGGKGESLSSQTLGQWQWKVNVGPFHLVIQLLCSVLVLFEGRKVAS